MSQSDHVMNGNRHPAADHAKAVEAEQVLKLAFFSIKRYAELAGPDLTIHALHEMVKITEQNAQLKAMEKPKCPS